jgi:hypothetical protein
MSSLPSPYETSLSGRIRVWCALDQFKPTRLKILEDLLGVILLRHAPQPLHVLRTIAANRVLILRSVVQVDELVVHIPCLSLSLQQPNNLVDNLLELRFIFLLVPGSVEVDDKVRSIFRIQAQRITAVLLHSLHCGFGDGLESYDEEDLLNVGDCCVLGVESVDSELEQLSVHLQTDAPPGLESAGSWSSLLEKVG